jgi:hypothetical protein
MTEGRADGVGAAELLAAVLLLASAFSPAAKMF